MIQRLFWAAIIAGSIAGAGVSVFHLRAAEPLILEAEKYEQAADHGAAGATGSASPAGEESAATGHNHDDDAAWHPDNGFERMAYTVLADLATGIGFSMLLFACFALSHRQVNAARGLLWGLAGFTTFWVAPAVGLPPELPGSATADLFDRQVWWLGTAAFTAGGLALIAFAPRVVQKLAGLALISVPHLIGAPQPGPHPSAVPAELAVKFVVVSLLSAAVLWLLLGGVGGWIYQRWNLKDQSI
jgi:cobalt transporter subunit CbtA